MLTKLVTTATAVSLTFKSIPLGIAAVGETNVVEIGAGDALGIYEQDIIRLKASEESVALWFELPK